MDRVGRLKLVLWMLVGLGAAVATARFLFGLGATTHLSDTTPWGLWVGFDVMSGVALAAGGFVVTASGLYFPSGIISLHRSARRPDRLPRLHCRRGRPDVRSGIALEHLAHDDLLESALAAVRGRLVRDALPYGFDAGVLSRACGRVLGARRACAACC